MSCMLVAGSFPLMHIIEQSHDAERQKQIAEMGWGWQAHDKTPNEFRIAYCRQLANWLFLSNCVASVLSCVFLLNHIAG